MSAYKPDWQEARERMIAWWTGKKTDRVPAQVSAPIKPARDRMMPWSRQTYDEACKIGRECQEGIIDGMQVWAPGRAISTQCDMSVLFNGCPARG